MIKTTGIEFNMFYNDANYWSEGVWHEYEVITVNGKKVDDWFDLGSVQDEDILTIEDGIVYLEQEGKDDPTFEQFFKKWRKLQANTYITVEVPVHRVAEFKQLVAEFKKKK